MIQIRHLQPPVDVGGLLSPRATGRRRRLRLAADGRPVAQHAVPVVEQQPVLKQGQGGHAVGGLAAAADHDERARPGHELRLPPLAFAPVEQHREELGRLVRVRVRVSSVPASGCELVTTWPSAVLTKHAPDAPRCTAAVASVPSHLMYSTSTAAPG